MWFKIKGIKFSCFKARFSLESTFCAGTTWFFIVEYDQHNEQLKETQILNYGTKIFREHFLKATSHVRFDA